MTFQSVGSKSIYYYAGREAKKGIKSDSQGQKTICYSGEGGQDAFHGHIVPFFISTCLLFHVLWAGYPMR